jgi:hypothetical protein
VQPPDAIRSTGSIVLGEKQFQYDLDRPSCSRFGSMADKVRCFQDHRNQSNPSERALNEFLRPFRDEPAQVHRSMAFEFDRFAEEFQPPKYREEIRTYLAELGAPILADYILSVEAIHRKCFLGLRSVALRFATGRFLGNQHSVLVRQFHLRLSVS